MPVDLGVGRPDDTLLAGVTAGAASCDAPNECLGVDGVLIEPFLVLDTGNAGSGAFGGPSEGRDGRGNVVVMLPFVCVRATQSKEAVYAFASQKRSAGGDFEQRQASVVLQSLNVRHGSDGSLCGWRRLPGLVTGP